MEKTEVESALKLWFTNVREREDRVNSPILRQKAEDLAGKLGKGSISYCYQIMFPLM